MAGSTETLGLELTADTSGWDKALASAVTSTTKLGSAVSSVASVFDSFLEEAPKNLGKFFTDAEAKAKNFGRTLASNWEGTANLGKILGDAQAKAKNFASGLTDSWDKAGNLGKILGEVEKRGLGVGTAIKGIASGLGSLGLAMAGVDAILKLGEAAVETAHFSAELANLRQNVPVDALHAMSASMDESVDEMTLLRFGMKALQSEVGLTVDGLGVLTKAADTLSDKGFGDALEIAEEFQRALETGNTSRLARFGVHIKETGDKQRDLNAAMLEFVRVSALPVNVNPQLMAIETLQKRTRDWMNDMKAGFGDLVTWGVGAFDTISDHLSGTGGGMRGVAERNLIESGQLSGGLGSNSIFSPAGQAAVLKEQQRLEAIENAHQIQALPMQGMQQQLLIAKGAGGLLAGKNETKKAMNPWSRGQGYAPAVAAWKKAQGRAKKVVKPEGVWTATGMDFFSGAAGVQEDNAPLGLAALGSLATDDSWFASTGMDFFSGAATGNEAANKMMAQSKAIDEFQAKLRDNTTAIGSAYDIASTAILSAVDAAISGSESMGRAIAKGVATAMKAQALQQAGLALAAGASALGALALGDGAHAAIFGKEAAMHAAAAAALGVGSATASALSGGGGGGSSGPYSQAGGGGYVGGQRQDSGPQNITINWYGGVTAGSEGAVGEELIRLVDKGRAKSGRSEINTGVTFE